MKRTYLQLFSAILFIGFLTYGCKTEPCVNRVQADPLVNCLSDTIIVYNGDTLIKGTFPVCGCDEFTYINECEAWRAGITFWTFGSCL